MPSSEMDSNLALHDVVESFDLDDPLDPFESLSDVRMTGNTIFTA